MTNTNRTFVDFSPGTPGKRYLLRKPGGAFANTREKRPLLVVLHGRGGTAGKCHLDEPCVHAFRDSVRELGWYAISPDYGSDCWGNKASEEYTLAAIDHAIATQAINPRRVVMIGMSMGAGATLTFAAHHPRRFAAVCAVQPMTDHARFYREQPQYHTSLGGAFGGSPDEVPRVYRDRSPVHHAETLATLPVMLQHGDKDELVTPDHSHEMHRLLVAARGKSELVIVPNGVHSNETITGYEDIILGFLDTAIRKR